MVASVGVLGWLIVGMLWHDRALIVLNAVSLAIYLMGVVIAGKDSYFLQGSNKRINCNNIPFLCLPYSFIV